MEKKYLDQYDDGNPSTSEDELSDDQLTELVSLVGEVLFRFNKVESDLDILITQVLNNNSYQPGFTVIAELSPIFTKKVSVFKALYGAVIGWLENQELNNLFEKVVEKLYKIKDVRNDIAHANWLGASKTYEVRLRIGSDEKGPYASTKVITPSDIRARISELEDANDLMEQFEEFFSNSIML